ncbi:hypothetical protein [Bifidobacterium longum]|uniref:hypothetical protein n=1 Tax=Bifidobacterium longum TaxID=216816 RepID=UPI001BA54714|nr:hypothetical protein [Bifidobacterium longum]QUF87060.1 hypothetical protein KDJ92_01910 [Bifidobacterium longum subsp. infantis]UUY28871.1 hypothetical protein NUU11_03295 [Bifidobacterium longum subsp. infantis]
MIEAPDALIRRSQYIRGADRLTGYQGTFRAFSHGRNLGGSPQRHHRGRPRHAGSRQAAIQPPPYKKDGVHPPHRANIRKQKPITRNPFDGRNPSDGNGDGNGNGNGIMAEPGTESAGKAKLRSRIGEIFLDGSGG